MNTRKSKEEAATTLVRNTKMANFCKNNKSFIRREINENELSSVQVDLKNGCVMYPCLVNISTGVIAEKLNERVMGRVAAQQISGLN